MAGQTTLSDESKSPPIRSREEFLERNPHLAEFLPFLDVLNQESARGVTLVAASYLENLLHQSIEAFLLEGKSREQLLSGFNAPIGTFSSKIALAAALGLIEERERRECDLLRKIRNKFAHNVRATFNDEGIKSLCLELTFRALPYEGVEVDARGSFTSAAVALISNLTNRPHYVSIARLISREWPR